MSFPANFAAFMTKMIYSQPEIQYTANTTKKKHYEMRTIKKNSFALDRVQFFL